MRIPGRIDRLERASARRGCPACASDGTVALTIAPPVARMSDLDRATQPRPGDRCPRCGRRLVLRFSPPAAAREGMESL
ncbi:MAG: hypothetical protein HBSAPP03_16130 [Phycisphaerae bacterium]|nr:MAG: hypothetical protein HBSAPP03_16130 [Phycisphaerae bacterium]